MAYFPRSLRRHPRVWLAVVGAVLAGGMLVAFTGAKDTGPDTLKSHIVTVGPFTVQQTFMGRIVPGDQVEILSPADATLVGVGFSYGQRVEEGQELFRLDGADVWRKQAEARVSLLQAEDEAARMANWQDGPDMRRARRSLEAAQAQHEDTRRRHDEAAGLFAKGLISRSEMDGLASALRQVERQVEAATEEMQQVLSRGTGTNRQVAMVRRELASAAYADVADRGAVVRAPRAGVMVRPARQSLGDDGNVSIGSKVTTGQSLGVVAAMDGLDVLFKVDEADLGLLRQGAKAVVTGPGFAGQRLNAVLTSVAGEADAGSSSDKTLFAARVRLGALPQEAAEILRVGMTAQVTLTLYEAPRAVTVPVAALVDGRPQVRVRGKDGRIATRRVTLGHIGPDEAEVRAGLMGGEEVVWGDAG